jgi:hypothetical protein
MKIMSFTYAASAAAVAYAASGAAVMGHSVPDEHWGARGAVIDAAGAAAFALTAVAMSALGPLLADTRLAEWSTRAAQLGLAAMTVESIASLVHGGNTVGALFFGGLLLALGGLVTLAVVGVRAHRLRWAAPLPALALIVGIAGGDHGGFLATGLVWVALAVTINLQRHHAPVPA